MEKSYLTTIPLEGQSILHYHHARRRNEYISVPSRRRKELISLPSCQKGQSIFHDHPARRRTEHISLPSYQKERAYFTITHLKDREYTTILPEGQSIIYYHPDSRTEHISPSPCLKNRAYFNTTLPEEERAYFTNTPPEEGQSIFTLPEGQSTLPPHQKDRAQFTTSSPPEGQSIFYTACIRQVLYYCVVVVLKKYFFPFVCFL